MFESLVLFFCYCQVVLLHLLISSSFLFLLNHLISRFDNLFTYLFYLFQAVFWCILTLLVKLLLLIQILKIILHCCLL